MIKVSVVFLVLQLCSGAEFDWCSLSCDGGNNHTMCIYRAGGEKYCALSEVKRGLTAEEKEVILEYHNQLRAKVANGNETRGPQPSAVDMNRLLWDDEIAEIAQRWLDQCKKRGHDKCRITKDKSEVGQNIAESGGSGMVADRIAILKQLVQSWYDEVKYMDPRLVASIQFNGPIVGHYTQMMWSKTTRVGCGLVHKEHGGDGNYYARLICNYKTAGNLIGQPVYTEGEAASKCATKSTKYPGLCEPQEEGDKPQTDASVPTSSDSSSLSGRAISGSLKTAFNKKPFNNPTNYALYNSDKLADPFVSARSFNNPAKSFASFSLLPRFTPLVSFTGNKRKTGGIQQFVNNMGQRRRESKSNYQLPGVRFSNFYTFSLDPFPMIF